VIATAWRGGSTFCRSLRLVSAAVEKTEAVRIVLEPHMPTGSRRPPKPVYSAVASLLVNPEDIKGSWTAFATNGHSTWQCWAVSSNALAYVEVEFDTCMHDDADEASRIKQRIAPAAASIKQAWKRPLAGVIELHVGCLPVDDVRLRFVDREVALPKRPFGGNAAERFDDFLAAIRAALPF
jgi:hypothetical protein